MNAEKHHSFLVEVERMKLLCSLNINSPKNFTGLG